VCAMADLVQPLDERQIARFKRDGFLQLRNVLDPQLCARAREVLWEHNEIHRLRHDPFGPFLYAEQDFPAAGDRAAASGPPPGGTRRGYRWHLSVVGSDPLFVDLVGGAAYPYAQQLLGAAQTSTPRASGGIHCTLPAAKGVGRFARRRGCENLACTPSLPHVQSHDRVGGPCPARAPALLPRVLTDGGCGCGARGTCRLGAPHGVPRGSDTRQSRTSGCRRIHRRRTARIRRV
jgi:hypothetical protein